MRSLTAFLTVVICLCSMANMARANCAVIDAVDNLHAVQSRLARDTLSPMYVSDIRFLRAQLSVIADRQVETAVGAGPLTGKGATFARFMRNTRALVQRASIDDSLQVRVFFNNPEVQADLQAVGIFLGDMRCTESQIAADAATARPDSDDSAAEVLRNAAKEVLDPTNILVVSTIIIAGIAGTKVISAWIALRRRRTKRHPAKFETTYMINDQTKYGVLHDISGYGAKLAQDTATPLTEKSAISILIFDEWIAGTVQWSNSHYSGINFKTTLKQNIVRKVSKNVTARETGKTQKNGARRGRRSETIV